jgi:hypothetical protein
VSRAGPELPERVELVRAALPDADQARFEQDLDQALDMAGSIRTCGLWARRRGLAACGLRSSARWPAVGGDRGAATPWLRARVGE